jgi:hypothetical protein
LHVHFCERGSFARGLLIPVLPDVVYAEAHESPDIAGRKRLRDRHQRDLCALPSCVATSGGQAVFDRTQVPAELLRAWVSRHGAMPAR